jgi:flagellin-like hook-associated protein FlgL
LVEAKTVDKKIKVVKKEITKNKKEMKQNKSVQSKKNAKHDSDIEMLKAEIEKLKKKKVARGHVSEYNIFIRKQIKSGMTFIKAAKQWSKYKSLIEKDKRRPSAYNQFIGSQMRLGKTWTQSVALWKLAKAGKLGKKGSTRIVTKNVFHTRTIKSKPTIKYRTRTITSKPTIKYRTRTIVKKVVSKPTIKYRTRTIVKNIRSKPVNRTVTRIVRSAPQLNVSELTKAFESSVSSHSISKSDLKEAFSPDSEEIAFKMIQTYFIEIARQGFKRQLTLDEIINAYFYALARVKRKSMEVGEYDKLVRK